MTYRVRETEHIHATEVMAAPDSEGARGAGGQDPEARHQGADTARHQAARCAPAIPPESIEPGRSGRLNQDCPGSDPGRRLACHKAEPNDRTDWC